MPVALRATCVGPEKTESELEAINLTFPCYQIWFGAEYIFGPHALFVFSQYVSLFIISLSLLVSLSWPSFFSIRRYRFRCGEQHFTFQPLKWSLLFSPPMLLWLYLLYVNELGCVYARELVNVIFAASHSLSAQHQRKHTDVDTMTVLPVGNSFVVQSREEKAQTVTSLPWCYISYVTLQSIQQGKCTIKQKQMGNCT